ncbi:MAG TPA: intradiol ring-cleavage dioxygenase [Ignavibacteria bacterium]|jgi:protocatechuate 3,4-dioxygenase beta subunit
MKKLVISFISILLICGFSCSQDKDKTGGKEKTNHVGGPCEGCEAIFESPLAFENLTSTDTLPDYNEAGPKLIISGIVYKKDGITPAPDIVIYIYHTDQNGYYSGKGNATGWGKRHGYIRGWMKTNEKGEYKFYTLKPAPYPNANSPAHIHVTIKEPDKNEYYIDEYVFEDDPLVDKNYRNMAQNRGGDGIISLNKNEDGMLIGKRDITLGKNIPDYP